MNFSKVIFVNYFHNGDLHISRQLVRAVMNKFPSLKYGYSHSCNPYILHDIENLSFVPKSELPSARETACGFFKYKNVLYLNTWYGAYKQKYNNSTGIAFDALYDVFNAHLVNNFNIKLKDIEPNPQYLFPTINFSKFKIKPINKFMGTHNNYKKKIFISNGHALSGQAKNFSFGPIINAMAKWHPNYLFIYTNKDDKIKKAENVICSKNIIGKIPCDLNENAYISTKCDIIIGRSSGAYTFSMIQDNMFNRDVKMISFSNIGKADGNYWLAHKFKGKIKYRAEILNFKQQRIDSVQSVLKGLI